MCNYYTANYYEFTENNALRIEMEIIKLLRLYEEYQRMGEIKRAAHVITKINNLEMRQRYIFMSTERKCV